MARIPGEIYDINCQYFKERNGKKAVWVHRDVVSKLSAISHKCSVEPAQLLDYLLRTGITLKTFVSTCIKRILLNGRVLVIFLMSLMKNIKRTTLTICSGSIVSKWYKLSK